MRKSLTLATMMGVLGTLSFSEQLKAGVAIPAELVPAVSQQALYGDEGGDEARVMTAGGPWSGSDVRLYYAATRSKKGEGGEGGEGGEKGKGREGGEGGEGGEGLEFRSNLSAAQETADPASGGSGEVRVKFNRDLSAVFVKLRVRNLVSPVADAHLHCAFAGQDGPILLPLSPTTGGLSGKIVKDRFNNADLDPVDCVATCGFPVNNIASLRFAAEQGCIYANVHTNTFPLGEVRGQLLSKE